MLNTVIHGVTGASSPLLIAHGLFGSARNWGAIAKRLADRGEVTAVDMRNHGLSDWKDSQTYFDMAEDLAACLTRPSDVLGHSMGGKSAMVAALKYPEKLNKLIVADIAPVAYQHSQRHLIEAMRAVDLAQVETRRDADEQLDIAEDTVRAFLLQSLDVKEKKWRLNLDVLDAEMDGIIGFPELDLPPFEGPTLFLSGADSDYVKPEHRDKIKSLFPKARFAKIPKAGHWLHAENPRAFEASVRAFLEA